MKPRHRTILAFLSVAIVAVSAALAFYLAPLRTMVYSCAECGLRMRQESRLGVEFKALVYSNEVHDWAGSRVGAHQHLWYPYQAGVFPRHGEPSFRCTGPSTPAEDATKLSTSRDEETAMVYLVEALARLREDPEALLRPYGMTREALCDICEAPPNRPLTPPRFADS